MAIAPPSFLQVSLSDLTRGAACGLDAGSPDYGGDVIQRWLPDGVVRRIADGDLSTGGWIHPGLPYLVMLTAHGDPLPIFLTPEAASTPWLREALDGIRTEPFFIKSPHCNAYDMDEPGAELASVTSGVACPADFAVPARSAQLDPELVTEIAARFDAEAVWPSEDYGGMSGERVTLLDDAGRFLHLDRTVNGKGLITERGQRYWEVPADIREALVAHGLVFEESE